ncbi:YebC/PmpR family DNA-binding transcriptional regulator [Candidatus Falkowbacteria bacterium HGW-Falkowbacteria-2]|uniref:Probable transcriptional regulatory protein CVU83_02260 n=1 Tax=Candidatus Falkowbacteria bacterium HGW-Falkowbacteria-2 TaxID=2013769 RepID=A0A2N2DZZ9_9BACT|nr:MAG: YebC/PmpR family DNA-binding transcriptional regulator [Candidatus Falkowbacteria bacterium HGW-Falkowbacteria-2]
MSGHSKWATTHRQKELVDAKRGAIFTKLGNIISIAAKSGGDPATNPSLRAAVDRARDASMPKDNIERAIKKGTGELGGDQVEELYYEGIGPAGVQTIVKCTTDNRNRSGSTVRHIFTKNGGSFGAVMWNFDQAGIIMITQEELTAKKIDFDEFELELIDGGASDIERAEEGVTIYTALSNFQKMQDYLKSKDIKTESAEIGYVAKEKTSFNEEDTAKIEKFLEEFDDNEDVSDYYTNIAD